MLVEPMGHDNTRNSRYLMSQPLLPMGVGWVARFLFFVSRLFHICCPAVHFSAMDDGDISISFLDISVASLVAPGKGLADLGYTFSFLWIITCSGCQSCGEVFIYHPPT